MQTSTQSTVHTGAQAEIGLITVNYNSVQATAQLLNDLRSQDSSRCRLRVVVADNSAEGDDLAPVRAVWRSEETVHFLSMPSNLGYFGAAHEAFQQFWPDGPPDWLIVANPDIRLPQADFFSRLAQLSASDGAVLAPRIVSGRTGLDQNPFHRRRPSVLRMRLFRLIPRLRFLHRILGAQSQLRRSIRRRLKEIAAPFKPCPGAIYAPHGAFVIFSREYFQHGADLNVGCFLYAEEIFVAESCRRLGLTVNWVPALEVLHNEHVSMRLSPAVRRFQVESADYCYREFFSSAADLRMKR